MKTKAFIFDIKRDCSEDGPGIRTTVFFKGCPLNCSWCQNPEGKDKKTSLYYDTNACQPDHCNAPCIPACPQQSLTLNGRNTITVERASCTACQACVNACPKQALQTAGYWMDVDELIYRLLVDKPFYQSSAGGVTLSGGEVTQQMDIAHQLLKSLKQQDIHTTIETCGFFNYRRFQELILPWTDLIYFDLKLIDDTLSRQYTGQSNRLILNNFSKLAASKRVTLIPRIPMIPGITTRDENLNGIASFISSQGINVASLLPYNPMWHDKANKLGMTKQYQRNTFMTPQERNHCVALLQASHQLL